MRGSGELAMIAQQCLMDRPTDRADASGILVQLEEMKQEAPSGGGGGGGRARSQQQRHTAPEVRKRTLFPAFDRFTNTGLGQT